VVIGVVAPGGGQDHEHDPGTLSHPNKLPLTT
jgi:hypothetical protein